MKKTLCWFFAFFFFCHLANAQMSIAGKYTGYSAGERTYQVDKKGREKPISQTWVPKPLQLNADSSFIFEYEEYCGLCNQGYETRRCTGRWKFKSDTVYLSSTFRETDFISAKEFYEPTKEAQLVKLILLYPDDMPDSVDVWPWGVKFRIDEKQAGDCEANDTLYYKGAVKKEIEISSKLFGGYNWRNWEYKPLNKNSNVFLFTLKRSVRKENLYFTNEKLVLKNDMLIPVFRFGHFQVAGERYYKREKK